MKSENFEMKNQTNAVFPESSGASCSRVSLHMELEAPTTFSIHNFNFSIFNERSE
jgi:hypothetical protein